MFTHRTPDPAAAVNARQATVVDFGVDPNQPGRSIAHEAFLRLHGFLSPVYSGGDVSPETQFHGLAAPVQDFRGLAAPAANSVTYRNGGNAELSSAVSAGVTGDPTRRIFADRLRRRV